MFCVQGELNMFAVCQEASLWFVAAQTVCGCGVSPGARPTLLPLPEEPAVGHLHVYWRCVKEWRRTLLLQNGVFADFLRLLMLIRWKGRLLCSHVAEEVSHNIAGQWDRRVSNQQDEEEPARCSGLDTEPRLGIVFITVKTRIFSPIRCCSKARNFVSWRPTWRASRPAQESECDSCRCLWRRWLRRLMMSTSCLEETRTWGMQRFVLEHSHEESGRALKICGGGGWADVSHLLCPGRSCGSSSLYTWCLGTSGTARRLSLHMGHSDKHQQECGFQVSYPLWPPLPEASCQWRRPSAPTWGHGLVGAAEAGVRPLHQWSLGNPLRVQCRVMVKQKKKAQRVKFQFFSWYKREQNLNVK